MKRYVFNVKIIIDIDEELHNDFIEGLTELLNDEVGDVCKVSVKKDTKWQKLERWLTDKNNNSHDDCDALLYTNILLKMQELEGEDE